MVHSVYRDIAPCVTRDGSSIRERMHPKVHGSRAQSLAQARVAPAGRTRPHHHRQIEEIYYFTGGHGRLRIDDGELAVTAGHTVLIPPGRWHSVTNKGREDLVLLCGCSPGYSHAETQLQPASSGGAG
jgi:mannose-6-phosphate isomerase-like protein (cupin superfamily)